MKQYLKVVDFAVDRFAINYILQMEISHMLSKQLPAGRTQLRCSIIEPDGVPKNNQNQFIIKKVALAQKMVVQDYLLRENISHPNVPTLQIENNSKFYITIHIEKTKPFFMKDLSLINLEARTNLLIDILKAIKLLAGHYGFFYVNQKLLSYGSTGRVKVWINDDISENKSRYPINHGKISEQIFVADFKECFRDSLRSLMELHGAKSIDSLTQLMAQSQFIYQNKQPSELLHKNSFILRTKEITPSFDDRILSKMTNQNRIIREAASPYDNSFKGVLKRQISISYLPVQGSQIVSELSTKMLRTVSNPSNYRASFTCQGTLNFNKLYPTKKSLLSCTSSQNLVRKSLNTQGRPKIQFNYDLHKQAMKKKKQEQESKNIRLNGPKNNMSRTSTNNLFKNSYQQSSPLKVSFPHTTTHTFTPFASNGNINLQINEINSQRKQGVFVKEEGGAKHNLLFDPLITEESNEVQMDLDCLFSDAGNDLQSPEQLQILQILAQQFENILLA